MVFPGRAPGELTRVGVMLDESMFDPRIVRPSTPMETHLRLMFLKFREQLGYESLRPKITDSITWRRFCRIRDPASG